MLYGIVRRTALGVLRVGFRLRAVGLEHVPSAGPALLAANHVSALDAAVVGAAVRRPLHFMAKAELFRVPVLGGLVRRLNAHPVERSGADATALRLALGLLRDGQALVVFPEGTRGGSADLRPGRAGTGMLAALGAVPVVPVYVAGTLRALPRGRCLPRPTRITVAYGPPLRFDRIRGRTRYQAISDEIMAAIGRLKAEVDGRPLGAVPAAVSDHRDRPVRGAVPAGQIQ